MAGCIDGAQTNTTPFSELCVLWSPEEDTGANPPQDPGQLHSTLFWGGGQALEALSH